MLSLSVTIALGVTGVVADTNGDRTGAAGAEGVGVGVGVSGSPGLHRVQIARRLSPGELLLSAGSDYSRAHDLFAAGDRNERMTQRLSIVWCPMAGLDVGLQTRSSLTRNSAFADGDTRVDGDPTLRLRGVLDAGTHLSLLGALAVQVPAAKQGLGLAPEAFNASLLVGLTWRPRPWLNVSSNLGYGVNNGEKLFDGAVGPPQRFGSRTVRGGTVVGGVGLGLHVSLPGVLALAPAVEVTGAVAPGVRARNNPIQATAALEFAPLASRRVAITVGADVRLAGAPRVKVVGNGGLDEAATASEQLLSTGPFPGLPPWEAFARLSVRIQPPAEPPPPGFVEEAAPRPQSAPEDTDRFTVVGKVVDDVWGKPVPAVVISLSGHDGILLTADAERGSFRTWPLESGEGILQLTATAEGYRPATLTIPRESPDVVRNVTLTMRADNSDAPGLVRGTVKDSRTGEVVRRARVSVSKHGLRIKPDGTGAFELRLPPGGHEVVISAKGYRSQTKAVQLSSGQTIVFNIDLHRRHRARRAADEP